MLIPESKIDEIRSRVDLIALLTRHGVELKKSGRSYKGCCPFHSEKTPSFHVWPESKRYKCFGCDAGGDAFSFMQRFLGKTFIDTVKELAKEVGVDLDVAVDPKERERAQIKEATDFAAEHFKSRLWDPELGKEARQYLLERGVSEEMARKYGLGLSLNVWTDLADPMRERGLLAFAEAAGLVAKRKTAEGYYDVFRGRLIIPIRSPEGRTIAFGGRLLGAEEGPKYLNSRESRLYNKSETLFGIDVAKEEIRRTKTAVLCEGYFDAIGMVQAGVLNAVALCSTALTAGHLAQLARVEAKELVLLLDGDKAGRAAVERLAPALLANGAQARVAALPEGEDPDTFAKHHGAAAAQQLIRAAVPLSEYLFSSWLPGGATASFEAKMGALEKVRPLAAALPVGLMRSAFFASLSRHFGLRAAELETALKGSTPTVRAAPKPVPVVKELPADPLEAMYVACALREKRLLAKDTLRVADELRHDGLRSLVGSLLGGLNPEDALYDATPGTRSQIEKAMLPASSDALEVAFVTTCIKLKVRGIDDELRRITSELRTVSGAADLSDGARELLEQQGQLLALKRQVLGTRESTRSV